MAQRQQAIIGVFAIELIISPMTVKGAFVGPKRIDKIQTRLMDGFKGNLQRG
jgi:hypothetical protein